MNKKILVFGIIYLFFGISASLVFSGNVVSNNSDKLNQFQNIYTKSNFDDQDFYPDIAVTNNGDDYISVLLNDGTGQFSNSQDYDIDSNPTYMVGGDFNEDEYLDLFVATSGEYEKLMFLGNGDGTFSDSQSFFYGGWTINEMITGDFNNDEKLDIAMATGLTEQVYILFGDGNGGFLYQQDYEVEHWPRDLTAGDFNQDGSLDIAVVRWHGYDIDHHLVVMMNDGNGNFNNVQEYEVGAWLESITNNDFNQDGYPDLAMTRSGYVNTLLNDGNGNFANLQRLSASSGSLNDIISKDFNQDGSNDLAIAEGNDYVEIFQGNGNGGFGNKHTYAVGDYPQRIVSEDFNLDGCLDIATSNENSDSVSIIFGNGNGGFGNKQEYMVGNEPLDIVVGNFNANVNNEDPVADFSWSPSNPDEGDTVYFDASSSYDPDGSIVTYLWDFDDDGSFDDGSGEDVNYIFTNQGDYPVSLKVTDNDGAIDTITKTVTVVDNSQPPIADFSWIPSNPTEGQTISFDASGSYDPDGSIVTYLWDFDDDGSFDDGSGVKETYSYQNEGNYQVSLKVKDNAGLIDTETKIVYVSGGGNQPPVADFSWSPSNPDEGDTVYFDASSSYDPDGSIVTYLWDFDDDGSFDDGAGSSPSYSWSDAGNHPVCLKVTDDYGAVDTETKIVYVSGGGNQPPVADFSFYPDPGMVGEPVSFDASDSNDPDGSISSYSWSFGDGITGSGVDTSHIFTSSGNFVVSLTVIDDGGLSDSKSKQISIASGDNIPPIVEINSPQNNEQVSGTVTISGSASDSDGSVSYVQIKIDSESWQSVSGTNSWSKSWETTSYSNGNHAISARSFDGEDYSSTYTVVVYVQNGGGDTAELPELDIGELWNYNVQDLYLHFGEDIFVDGDIDNLQLEVVSKNSNYYTLEANGEFDGSAQIVVEIGESEVPIPFNNIEREFTGEMILDVDTIGLKKIEGTVELPFSFLGTSYKIKFVITISFDTAYDFFDFPITEGETWTVEYELFDYTIEVTLYKWKLIGQYWNLLYEKQFDENLPLYEHTCSCTQVQNGEFKIESTIDDSLYYWYSPSEKAAVESNGFINFYSGYITIEFDMSLSGCPPNKPNKPIGKNNPKAGETCQYSASTVDPNCDLVQYGWDWDGNKVVDEWTSYYESGETCVISHIWTSQELSGKSIRVKARDINAEESPWSDSLDLNTARQRTNHNIFVESIMKLISRFPVIFKIFFSFLY